MEPDPGRLLGHRPPQIENRTPALRALFAAIQGLAWGVAWTFRRRGVVLAGSYGRVGPTDARVEPTDTSVALTCARVGPTDARVEPTDTSFDATDASITHMRAPVDATDARLDAMDVRIVATAWGLSENLCN